MPRGQQNRGGKFLKQVAEGVEHRTLGDEIADQRRVIFVGRDTVKNSSWYQRRVMFVGRDTVKNLKSAQSDICGKGYSQKFKLVPNN